MLFALLSMLPFILFDQDGGGGGGDGGGGGTPPAQSPNDTPPAIQNLINRNNGDAMAAIATLLSENAQLRADRRALREKLPADGSIVLTGEQAQFWSTLDATKLDAAKLKELQDAATERDQLRADRDKLQRNATINDAANVAGFKPTVLATLIGDLSVEIDDGETRVAYVKDGDKRTPLVDYAAQHWADFLPSLQQTTQRNNGTPWPPQAGNGSTTTKSPVESALENMYKRK